MQKLKSHETGIAHLGLILVLIVVFAVGGATYLVVQRQNDKKNETAAQLVDADEENAIDADDDEANESNELAAENEADVGVQ